MNSEHVKNANEQHKALLKWNLTDRDYPQDSTFTMLFEKQVRLSPDAEAVVFAGSSLSYQALNSRANQLAHYLQNSGVKAETLVGLCVDRGLDLVIGILAIQKAGGVYLPLDPTYPEHRLRFMLNDAAPSIIITQNSLQRIELTQLWKQNPAEIIHIDTDGTAIGKQSKQNVDAEITVDNLAYVIYTSGTTGEPKGTLVEHRGLSNVSAEQIRYFDAGPGSRILQFSSPNFDASLFDIVMALASGASLVLASQDELLPGFELINLLREQAISILTLPPSVLNVLPVEFLPALKVINVAGEACPAELVARWASERRFFNLYGPTECSIWVTAEQCQRADKAPCIGRPIGNTRVYILDENLQPVAVGEAGEMFVAGVGIARGYLNRASMTEEKFLLDPFACDYTDATSCLTARMYRTGDKARYLADGKIEFLGRVDEQIKIRGFRIEPVEVETVLARQVGVDSAVVLACKDASDINRLVAYVVPESLQTDTLNMQNLRRNLQKLLPAYMLPSIFVEIEKLPLTLNGKLDRQALPVPHWRHLSSATEYQPPRNDTEKRLAAIYCEVLAIEQAGIADDFFLQGGHSLNASRLIARVRQHFNIELPFRRVFECPVLSDLAVEIEQCVKNDNNVESFSIIPAVVGEPLPLSFSQERVWFVQQLNADNRAYHAQATIRWTGELNIAFMEQALTEMVRRHEILRTTFIDNNGVPAQQIHSPFKIKLQLENFTLSEQPLSEQQISSLVEKAYEARFDLTQLPLVRWTIIRISKEAYLMTHVEHHLIHDGWSFNVFMGELMALYKAYCEKVPSPLAEPDIQFSDFVRWQRHWLKGSEADRQRAYWQQKLAGSQPLLELPYDRTRPAVQRFQGKAPRYELPETLCAQVEKLCDDVGVTPFMVFLSALYVLLYRYSSQSDICIGTGMANRRWQQTEQLLGMIINNIVLRTDISGDPTVHALLHRVRECVLDASGNQDLPFEKVVEVIQPERSLSYNPLFQVMFGMHDSPMTQSALSGLRGEMDLAVANGGAKFDLTMVVVPGSVKQVGLTEDTEPVTQKNFQDVSKSKPESWTVIWEYCSDLFDAETADKMFFHYQQILQGMVSMPDCRLSQLSMLNEKDTQQLLNWHRPQTDYPKQQTIQQLFEQQVAERPDAIAIEHENDSLSYAQLNEQANRLAHYLQAQGVGPEVLVGLSVERSLSMMVAILGIIKAGGAYLPLDPDYPQSRLSYMLADAKVPVVISTSSQAEHLPSFDGEMLCLDTQAEQIAQCSRDNPDSTSGSDSLAYVIYTSGSTGQPKGTLIEQHSVVRLIKNTNYVELGPDEIFLQFAPIAFDASTFELWGSLLNGAKLVISPAGRVDLETLGALIEDKGITTLWLTSALFQQMVDHQLNSLCGVRQLLTGGETLSLPHAKKMLAAPGEGRLVNCYGPTENTTFTSFHVMEKNSELEHNVPIGRAISNTTVYILNKYMQPVPVGVPGELYIGGDGLARGYLNQPALTAEKFIEDPYSDVPGARLYRTGDRVRYHRDGNIEFIGRFDHQVKVRGYRIEPGEIETALIAHENVNEAVVVVREDEPGDKRLVAYVIPAQGQKNQADDLRVTLQLSLPAYMVPSVIISLDKLPLTVNGKLDLSSLPEPDSNVLQSGNRYIVPRNNREQRIAAIWKEVLKLDRIGVHDNFFHLGGHSLLATQIISRLKEEFDLDVPINIIFDSPSVAELAICLDAALLLVRKNKLHADETNGERESGEL